MHFVVCVLYRRVIYNTNVCSFVHHSLCVGMIISAEPNLLSRGLIFTLVIDFGIRLGRDRSIVLISTRGVPFDPGER